MASSTKWKTNTFLLFVFLCASVSVVFSSEDEEKENKEKGVKQADKLNNDFPGEMVYHFTSVQWARASSPTVMKSLEFHHQETNCKKSEVKTTEERNYECKKNVDGKTVICESDMSTCKSTGNKYTIQPLDARSQVMAILAAEEYNNKLPKEKKAKLHLAVTITEPMEREIIAGGWKDFVLFSAREYIFEKSTNNKTRGTYHITKPRVDCHAIVTSRFTKEHFRAHPDFQIKCKENSDPAAVKALPPYIVKIDVCTEELGIINGTEIVSTMIKCLSPSVMKNDTDKSTTMAGEQVDDPEDLNSLNDHKQQQADIAFGAQQAEKINNEFPVEDVYIFVSYKMTYGSSRALANSLEFHHQETQCKKAKVKTTEERNYNCPPNLKGRTIICHRDITTCKSTGDKYVIPANDERSQSQAILAVTDFNNKVYKGDKKSLHYGITVTAPMQREVLAGGWKDIIHFSTRETIEPDIMKGESNFPTITMPRVDCKASVTTRIYENDIFEVICQENKNPTAISALPNYNIEKTVCSAEFGLKNGTDVVRMSISCISPAVFKTSLGKDRVTAMSGESKHNEPSVEEIIQDQANTLNKETNPENLFIPLAYVLMYGSNSDRKLINEIYCMESECKANSLPEGKTNSCRPKLEGKIAICPYGDNNKGSSACKFTGDHYDINEEDIRSYHLAYLIIQQRNDELRKTNAKAYDSLDLSDFIVTAAVKTEVTNIGTRNIVHFATRGVKMTQTPNLEVKSINDPPIVYKSDVVTPRLDCVGLVEYRLSSSRSHTEVNCVPSSKTLPTRKDTEVMHRTVTYRENLYLTIREMFTIGPHEKISLHTTSAEDGKEKAKKQCKQLVSLPKEDFLFRYVVDVVIFQTRNEPLKTEAVFSETECKNADLKNDSSEKPCNINPKKKLAICLCHDFTTCKYTGDSYEIDRKNPVLLVYGNRPVKSEYTKKHYPKENNIVLVTDGLQSNVEREVQQDGFKDTYKFNAKEIKCTYLANGTLNCETLKENINCEAVMKTTVNFEEKTKKWDTDVKCPGHTPTKATSESVKDKARSWRKVKPPSSIKSAANKIKKKRNRKT